MAEWGLVCSYRDYFELPEPVIVAWRACVAAQADAAAQKKP